MLKEHLDLIDAAVAVVADRLGPEDRFDLRQDLALKLLSPKKQPILGDLGRWLIECAFNWTADFLRRERRRRETESSYASGIKKRYRTGPIWEPKEFPPHKDATEGSWLAVEGARLMHVKTQ